MSQEEQPRCCDSCGTSRSQDWWFIKEEKQMTVCDRCKAIFSGERNTNIIGSLAFYAVVSFIIIAAAIYLIVDGWW